MNDKDNKNTQKVPKIEISFIFKFRMVELKFAAKIIVRCQLCNLLENSAKSEILLFLKLWNYVE